METSLFENREGKWDRHVIQYSQRRMKIANEMRHRDMYPTDLLVPFPHSPQWPLQLSLCMPPPNAHVLVDISVDTVFVVLTGRFEFG